MPWQPNQSMITAMDRTFLLIGAVLGFLGVALGAFGAHALKSRLSPEMLAVFETGVRYQMYHAFAVLIVAAAIGHIGNARLLVIAGWFFFAGILLFSGSLYALALTNVGILEHLKQPVMHNRAACVCRGFLHIG